MASLCVFTTSLFASNINNNEYKQTVLNYIDELLQVRNQVFTLAQKTTFSSEQNKANFNADADIVNRSLNGIIDSMNNYYESLPDNSTEKTNMLVLFNAASLIKGALFQLSELNKAASDVERMIILEDYFRFRLEATDTMNLVRDLVSQ